MCELTKNGKLFTSKYAGTGPSSYEKKNLPVRGITKAEKYWINPLTPNDYYSGRTATLTSKVAFYIFIQQI